MLQLLGRPGVCFVTRGPGATNAAIALHIARQASIPLVLGVGQVARANLGRDSFQEVDYEAFFRPLVKHVEQVNDPGALSAAFARAFQMALSGRPGPVVLALPEDVLASSTTSIDADRLPITAQGIISPHLRFRLISHRLRLYLPRSISKPVPAGRHGARIYARPISTPRCPASNTGSIRQPCCGA